MTITTTHLCLIERQLRLSYLEAIRAHQKAATLITGRQEREAYYKLDKHIKCCQFCQANGTTIDQQV